MPDLLASFLAGVLRPFGPAALVCLPLAVLGGCVARVRSARASLAIFALALLAFQFADPSSIPRAPHLLLRLLCVAGLVLLALQRRRETLAVFAGTLALIACGYCLVELPGPLRSLAEPPWPLPLEAGLRWAPALGSALTLASIFFACGFLPRASRPVSIPLLAILFVVTASGASSTLLAWAVGHWPFALAG